MTTQPGSFGAIADEMSAFCVTVADAVAEVTILGPGKGNAMGDAFWQR